MKNYDKSEEQPDTSEAEKWLDPDTFVVKGKIYHIEPDSKVVEVKKAL